MATKTKADRALEEQLELLLREGRRRPDPGLLADGASAERLRRGAERPLPLDQAAVALALERYGAYLELVEGDEPAGQELVFQWPAPPIEEEPETQRLDSLMREGSVFEQEDPAAEA